MYEILKQTVTSARSKVGYFIPTLLAKAAGLGNTAVIQVHPWPGNAMVEGKIQDLCLANRKRKNLKVEMPKLADYNDKL